MRPSNDSFYLRPYTVLMTEKNFHTSSAEIGSRIAFFRKQKGLTQAELADRVGISRLLLSDYERGKVRIYADVLFALLAALGVPVNKFLSSPEPSAPSYTPSIKLVKRLQRIEKLSPSKQKALLQIIDGFLKGEGF
ncbi:helix-turn-helix domain-containing protein [Brucepastera parasyntrophica]|uniref:helix-turn-helix domain-containing protein n=1 Tax=Brucepastera parasyntrophica TaxID=2880008 RepID=UPI00210BFA36|nr:helix-turn-helix transcriptional regulator [Brucepastera parasyntrophica]ULQ59098.1 helix-turn-helix domain-containing protein [Brucepastera parasyntrophica]ULQ59109.1 helix-turn-helix domain-containing protein [Brucepastera parasyntrophica]